MKLQPDVIHGPSITGYGSGWVAVNGKTFSESLIVRWTGTPMPWGCSGFDRLDQTFFEKLIDSETELILFGSGNTIKFPQPAWLQSLYSKRIGVETMDTQAACRTFNFLSSEGRKVVAALLL